MKISHFLLGVKTRRRKKYILQIVTLDSGLGPDERERERDQSRGRALHGDSTGCYHQLMLVNYSFIFLVLRHLVTGDHGSSTFSLSPASDTKHPS